MRMRKAAEEMRAASISETGSAQNIVATSKYIEKKTTRMM